jgi:L-lysine 2,3-aminomutase
MEKNNQSVLLKKVKDIPEILPNHLMAMTPNT